MIGGLSRFLGRIRGLYIPLGVFALLAVGLHAGGDRADDHLVVIYNALDAQVDDALTTLLSWILSKLSYTPAEIGRATFVVVDFIDLETKEALARWTALIGELWADLMLAVPLLVFRRRNVSWSASWQAFRQTPNIHWVAAPVTALFASIAGSFVMAREIQVGLYAGLSRISALDAYAGMVAGGLGGLAMGLVLLRLGTRATASTISWAESRARTDRTSDKKPYQRYLRGLWVALIALPLAALAVFEAVPFSATLSALFAGL